MFTSPATCDLIHVASLGGCSDRACSCDASYGRCYSRCCHSPGHGAAMVKVNVMIVTVVAVVILSVFRSR